MNANIAKQAQNNTCAHNQEYTLGTIRVFHASYQVILLFFVVYISHVDKWRNWLIFTGFTGKGSHTIMEKSRLLLGRINRYKVTVTFACCLLQGCSNVVSTMDQPYYSIQVIPYSWHWHLLLSLKGL